MKYEKQVLATMNKCYSIAQFDSADTQGFLVATEKEGPCLLFDLDGNLLERVWEGPGGVMTMVQVPGRTDQFLSTQEFYSPNCGADDARIVICTRKAKDEWEVTKLCDLPYVHRFGILKAEDGSYHLIACTIKSACEYKEDWRFPGVTYVAPLPVDRLEEVAAEGFELQVLLKDQLKNHGFYTSPNRDFCLVTTDEAVFKMTPPSTPEAEWKVETLLQKAVSDACLVDFRQNGRPELLTMSDFHGSELAIYSMDEAGTYQQVYLHDEELPFLHAIWSGELQGSPCAVIGHRKGDRKLLRVFFADGRYQTETIDESFGPANAWVYQHNGVDHIVSANRETDELALYRLTK